MGERQLDDDAGTPATFLYRRPVRAEEAGDLFRQGMLRIARATGDEEKRWLSEAIAAAPALISLPAAPADTRATAP
ncbi:hypothetical protein ACWDZ6_20615 [Streptomyces sp. NPDC002926]